eukprot:scaffold3.g6502.t1
MLQHQGSFPVRASRVSSPEEDKEVAHAAYMHAFQESAPAQARIPGMQEFAGALLARQRIPSQQYTDPLQHIFNEFDEDHTGYLSAHEVAAALRSRQVQISDEQAQMFIDAVDADTHRINVAEFRELILHMAAADLHHRRMEQEQAGQEPDSVTVSWEEDEEIQTRLHSWIDHIMQRRNKKQ